MAELCLNLIFTILLCAAGVWDLLRHRIPDWLCAGMLAVGIGALFWSSQLSLWERLLGGAAVSVPLLLISLLIPGAFGGGDVKLMAAGGFFLGAGGILKAFALAMAGSGAAGVCLLAAGQKAAGQKAAGQKAAGRNRAGRLRLPIGPFLCAGILAVLYCGEGIVLS